MSAEVGGWNKGMNGGKKVQRGRSVGSSTDGVGGSFQSFSDAEPGLRE